METPTQYAEKIIDLLEDTDSATATFALRIATVLLDHKASVAASAALASAREGFETSDVRLSERTALSI